MGLKKNIMPKCINSDEMRFSMSVGVLNQLVRYLNHLCIKADEVLSSAGVDPAILASPDERISYNAYVAIEDASADASGDPYFGLHMGEFFEAGNWTILGFMMANCKTVGEAFEKSGRYSRVIGNLIVPSVHLKYKKVKVILHSDPQLPKLSRHCYEAALSSTMRMARYLSGREMIPLEVGFSSTCPGSLDEYVRVFRCPVHFEQDYCYIMLGWDFINTPVILPNSSLLEHFEAYANEYLASIGQPNDTTGEVIKQIIFHLDNFRLSETNIAHSMSMSTRTLQVHLKREGKKFSELVQDVRMRLAKRYLREQYTVEDITYLLGFSDPSVFRKSFKRWTGMTPKAYRDGT